MYFWFKSPMSQILEARGIKEKSDDAFVVFYRLNTCRRSWVTRSEILSNTRPSPPSFGPNVRWWEKKILLKMTENEHRGLWTLVVCLFYSQPKDILIYLDVHNIRICSRCKLSRARPPLTPTCISIACIFIHREIYILSKPLFFGAEKKLHLIVYTVDICSV